MVRYFILYRPNLYTLQLFCSSAEAEIQILNCALHIEHLEDALYTEGLSRFSVQDFVNNGLEPWMYGRLQEILEHEEAHVEFLKSVVSEAGGKPVERCVYNLYVVVSNRLEFALYQVLRFE